jgi:hypothetical protein
MPIPFTSHAILLAQVAADRAARTPEASYGFRIVYKVKGGGQTTVLIPYDKAKDLGQAIGLLYRRAHVRFEDMIETTEITPEVRHTCASCKQSAPGCFREPTPAIRMRQWICTGCDRP